jgi:CTP:molybdopterin cytidylyltransferase MocA
VTVAVAILAAGSGTRFSEQGSGPKPLANLNGRPLVSWALGAAVDSALRPVVLVVGHEGNRVARQASAAVIVTQASGWRRGIAHSLRAALDLLDGWKQVEAVCVGLADQPRVGAEAYRRLSAAYDDGAVLAAATYRGVRANPVLIARELWPRARELTGDEGARQLMATHPVVEVECGDTGDPVDVDTVEALAALEHER